MVRRWLRSCRSFLRYNYDRSGVPCFKVRGPLCADVAYRQIGPVDTAIGDDIDVSAHAQQLANNATPHKNLC